MSDGLLKPWMRDVQVRIEQGLDRLLPPADASPADLHQAMRHAVLDGGKRVRPLLVHAAGAATGSDPVRIERAAYAVELIHAYSLVHDDMPCMDNDALRRGKPTVHVKYGEATALLAGDALQTLAFEVLAGHGALDSPSVDPVDAGSAQSIARGVWLLARASGAAGMAGGQALDLAATGQQLERSALERMHRLKTGALLKASVLLGAGNVNPDLHSRLETYADNIGLAYQVVDDVLDVETDTATLGKTAGKDAAQHKATYVSTLGLEASKSLAMRLRDEALAAVEPFGAAGQPLRDMVDLIVQRRA